MGNDWDIALLNNYKSEDIKMTNLIAKDGATFMVPDDVENFNFKKTEDLYFSLCKWLYWHKDNLDANNRLNAKMLGSYWERLMLEKKSQ